MESKVSTHIEIDPAELIANAEPGSEVSQPEAKGLLLNSYQLR